MSDYLTIRLGGVPEHFNYPIHLANDSGVFEDHGLEIEWKDFPGGTGAMNRALKNNELDAAIILTEGVTSNIIRGNPVRIVKVYVTSPLTWGFHVLNDSTIESKDECHDSIYAISRKASGSHLMAVVHANAMGWDVNRHSFHTAGNLDGIRQALHDKAADVFMWEKFTTKPYVDSGELRRVGEYKTPWPCFVIAVREDFLKNHSEEIEAMLSVINTSCEAVMENEEVISDIALKYHLDEADTAEWFASTVWSTDNMLPLQELNEVVRSLVSLEIVEKSVPAESLIHSFE